MRRHLGFSVDEWDALPWWQARLYREGLADEINGGPTRETSLDDLGVTVTRRTIPR